MGEKPEYRGKLKLPFAVTRTTWQNINYLLPLLVRERNEDMKNT
jgi:hypothetical protein